MQSAARKSGGESGTVAIQGGEMEKITIEELRNAIKDIGGTDEDYSTIQKVIAWILLEILKELRKK